MRATQAQRPPLVIPDTRRMLDRSLLDLIEMEVCKTLPKGTRISRSMATREPPQINPPFRLRDTPGRRSEELPR